MDWKHITENMVAIETSTIIISQWILNTQVGALPLISCQSYLIGRSCGWTLDCMGKIYLTIKTLSLGRIILQVNSCRTHTFTTKQFFRLDLFFLFSYEWYLHNNIYHYIGIIPISIYVLEKMTNDVSIVPCVLTEIRGNVSQRGYPNQGHPTSIFGKYLFGRRFEI